MARSTHSPRSSSNFRASSPFTVPLLLALLPCTAIASLLWPALALGSFIPVVGLISLTSLLSCTAFLYLSIPLTLHLLFSQDRIVQAKRGSILPFTFPHLPLFTPSLLTPFILTHSILRLIWEAYRASLISLYFDSISKRILILGGADSTKILKENIVYLTSNDPRNKSSKRLDVYYPDRSNTFAEEDEGAVELAPVILLIASPSYRFLSSKSFPSSQIALRLRRLGYCVVVPSLTSFPEGTAKEMVYEIRESLRWIKEEIRAFGGDKERVWVLGQGVGATLTALSVIQSAVVVSRAEEMEKRAQREERKRQKESRVDRDSRNGRDSDGEEDGYAEEHSFDPFLERGGGGGHSRDASNSAIYEGHYFRSTTHKRPTSTTTTVPYSDEEQEDGDQVSISSSSTLPFPSGVNACRVFSGPKLSEMGEEDSTNQPEDQGETLSCWDGMRIRGLILVGGSYDNIKQLKREDELGLSEISALRKIFGYSKADSELASSSHLLYAASSLLSSSSSSSSLLPSKFLLIHGGADRLVPYSQSVLLKNLLVGVGIKSEKGRLRLYREETGIGSLTSLMHQTRYSPLILDEIERMISSDVLDDLEEEEQITSDRRNTMKGQARGRTRKMGRR